MAAWVETYTCPKNTSGLLKSFFSYKRIKSSAKTWGKRGERKGVF
jgi:hypothetical protein